ncbi:MAG: hypothetical protein IPH37_10030 [Burkholderiales bacterium]|nr:hypothetical protein [Burkholderiales bacterium]
MLAWVQGLACAGLLGLMLSAGWPFVSGSQGQGNRQSPSNPLADVYGWDVAGQRALALAAQHGLTSVAVQNWTLASRMGWYARPLPVHVLEDRFTQFSLWAGDLPVGGDTLLVDWSQLAYTVPQARMVLRTATIWKRRTCSAWVPPLPPSVSTPAAVGRAAHNPSSKAVPDASPH